MNSAVITGVDVVRLVEDWVGGTGIIACVAIFGVSAGIEVVRIGETWVVVAWFDAADFIAGYTRKFVTWVTVDWFGGTGFESGV